MIKPSYEIPGPETGAGCTCAWIEQNYLKKTIKNKKTKKNIDKYSAVNACTPVDQR